MSILTQKLPYYRHPLFAVVITLLASLCAMLIYLNGPLGGSFNQFFLPAHIFGVPSDLRARGIQEIFKDDLNLGWDGQFYFYIANDPLGLKDTTQHIDANSYRFQRIGLPLLANIVSRFLFRPWVSPLNYFMTNLGVILLAVGVCARFFQKRGVNPNWILLWSLGMGTQVTLLSGLPDGAADGFLIIAIVSLLERQTWLYILAITFASLSREIYVVIPAFISLSILIQIIWKESVQSLFSYRIKYFIKNIIIHLIPILIWVSWQTFLRIKFGVSPASQASGILGLPFVSAYKYFWSAILGTNQFVGKGLASYVEGTAILFYLLLLLVSFFYLCQMIIKTQIDRRITLGMGLGFIFIIGMYSCFGPTVMMYHTGFFKAANVFLFVLPITFCIMRQQLKWLLAIFLIGITIFFDILLLHRISGPPYVSARKVEYATIQPVCLKEHRAKIKPISIEIIPSHHFIKRILGRNSTSIIINTEIENTSGESFSPFQGNGAVNVSYQWLDKNTLRVVRDGVRTPFTHTLKPHEKIIVPTSVNFPTKKGQYILKLTLVQEECSWFYISNPSSSYDILYTVN